MPVLRKILFFIICLLAIEPVSAQVRVTLSFKRFLYIAYEPVIATVTIENLTGRELFLHDSGSDRWFGFQIESSDGRLIPPRNANYQLQPVQIGAGQSIRRSVNVTPLYPISEYGIYRIKATVYVADMDRYFSSNSQTIEITEGKEIWKEVVGVPPNLGLEGGSTRRLSLLTHRLSKTTMLYLRIEDPDVGVVRATHQLGRYVTFGTPDVMLDEKNQIHVLQNVAPKTYLHSHIGLNGEVLVREFYSEVASRPVLRKNPDGSVNVVGGVKYDPTQEAQQQPGGSSSTPSLSDRPVPLPSPSKR